LESFAKAQGFREDNVPKAEALDSRISTIDVQINNFTKKPSRLSVPLVCVAKTLKVERSSTKLRDVVYPIGQRSGGNAQCYNHEIQHRSRLAFTRPDSALIRVQDRSNSDALAFFAGKYRKTFDIGFEAFIFEYHRLKMVFIGEINEFRINWSPKL
jgi:hypothetical protein